MTSFLKLVFLGDSGVGKSCLLLRYSDGHFFTTIPTTTGVDLKLKTIDIDGEPVKIKLWDTAGQERFRVVSKTTLPTPYLHDTKSHVFSKDPDTDSSYYRQVDGIILVYDHTDRRSFENLDNWLKEIEDGCGDKGLPTVLLSNKQDLGGAVTSEEGRQFAEQRDIPFFETSAKTGQNVSQAISAVAAAAFKHKPRSSTSASVESTVNIASNARNTSNESSCKC